MKSFLPLLFVVYALTGVCQESSHTQIGRLMQAYYDCGQYTGVVLVADAGEVIYQGSFGYRNYKDSVLLGGDERFRISSMTKQFTALLIIQLAQEGKLQLTDKITDHLPYYRKETGEKVSIHQLLNHHSGIPNISRNQNFRQDSIRIPFPNNFLVTQWCMGDLLFEPGTSSKYSNSNYNILGAIIEEITGKPFGEVLKEKILLPAKMNNTGLVPDNGKVDGMPPGYLLKKHGLVKEEPIAYSNFHAAGQMYSTAEDMYRWDRALASNLLLSKKWMDKIFTPSPSGHGYGWKVYRRLYPEQTDSCTTSYHAGSFEGFSSFIQRFHERDMVMIFMSNTNIGRRKTGTISDDIINIVFNLPYEVPVKKEPANMTPENFNTLAGTYVGADGKERKVYQEDNNYLYANKKGRAYILHPETESSFYFDKENRWTINFTTTTMTIHTAKGDRQYTKK